MSLDDRKFSEVGLPPAIYRQTMNQSGDVFCIASCFETIAQRRVQNDATLMCRKRQVQELMLSYFLGCCANPLGRDAKDPNSAKVLCLPNATASMPLTRLGLWERMRGIMQM